MPKYVIFLVAKNVKTIFAKRFTDIQWRSEPDVYELEVLFFGSTSGPCLAQEAKNKNALYSMKEYPEVAKAIIE